MQLLIDEPLSPKLATWAAELGVYAKSVPHVGLGGALDSIIWTYAFEHYLAVVTTNARDFIDLLDLEIHAGLIILRQSGLSRTEQWDQLKPVLLHVIAVGDPDFMVNTLIEVWGVGDFVVTNLP